MVTSRLNNLFEVFIMFTENIINQTCFYDKLVNIANGDFNNSANECKEKVFSLVEYLDSHNIVQCCDCGYFFDYDVEGYKDRLYYYCDDCKPQGYINEYHNYSIVNNSTTSDTFGIELEVEFDTYENALDCSEAVHDRLGETFIMAEDGSLNNGIEFISHVWDMRDINTFYLRLETLTDIIKEHGGVCHDSSNSGLHVHIGLKPDCDIDKLETFVYEHKHLFSCLSGRLPLRGTFEYARPYNNGRYSFINETDMTVEFRLWNSTLEPLTIVERVALSYYLYNFSQYHVLDEISFYRYLKVDDYFIRHGMPINLLAYCHKWLNKRFEDMIPYI